MSFVSRRGWRAPVLLWKGARRVAAAVRERMRMGMRWG
jgi:hypothetical protein